MNIKDKPIGFFDSGVGGLSVLREAIKVLPNENYIYLGDSKNAPYGVKSTEQVKILSFHAVEFLVKKGVKAVVVACNTATSAAITELRTTYKDIPIIGIEPALKPAVELNKKGKIIIMATPVTLMEKKFNKLMNKYKDKGNIVPLPCPGLVEFIEKGVVEGEDVQNFIKEKFCKFQNEEIACVVLGCTHYPFIKKELSKVLGREVSIIDGSFGTVNQLKRKLIYKNALNMQNKKGKITICNTANNEKMIDISYDLLNIK